LRQQKKRRQIANAARMQHRSASKIQMKLTEE